MQDQEENIETGIYVLASIQESRLPNGERVINENYHPAAVLTLALARKCLKKIKDSLENKGQVSPIMDDGFTIIYKNKKAVTWVIREKTLIDDISNFEV